MKKDKSRRSGGKRAALIALCIVLGLILTVLLGGTIYATRLMGSINRFEEEETLSQEQLDHLLAQEEEEVIDPTMEIVNKDDIDWGEVEKVEADEDIINILLIGQDARGNERARSDSMILCSFNKNDNTITMTSFLRDLYVKIPGYYDNRINAAYPAGGMKLLNETLDHNFGVSVDGNVEVNFGHFAEVIDVLGGVDVELTGAEANAIMAEAGGKLSAGMNHLNGNQALYYSRIRHLGGSGDFGRTERQRKVLNSIIEAFRGADLATMLNLVEEVLPMITTDMSNTQIISLATELFPMLANCTIVSQRVPADNTYRLTMIDGMSVILADMDEARALLKETLTD